MNATIKNVIRKLPREKKEIMVLSILLLRKRSNDPLKLYRKKYATRPTLWLRDFADVKLTDYQYKVFEAIEAGHRKIAIYGPHGLGKTVVFSLAQLWFGSTHADCKIPSTASVWRQLKNFLWPEIHKWSNRIDWSKIGKKPELLTMEAKFGDSASAFSVASNRPENIEGAHADSIFYVYDEAKAIPPGTWQASEGAFSTIGDHLQIAASTPGDTSGTFYDICSRKPGYEKWFVIPVSLEDCIRAGRMSAEWAEEKKKQWGENSPIYKNRVKGIFAKDSENTVIPLAWVELAIERWHEWKEAGSKKDGRHRVGVDISRGGQDKCSLAHAWENIVSHIEYIEGEETRDTMQTAGRVINAMGAEGVAKIDVLGVGAGVVDRIREQGFEGRVVAINAGESTDLTDKSGELRFANVRSAMWWGMREKLNPSSGDNVCLPPDDLLIGDLTTPKYKTTSNGKILIESKDDLRKSNRLGRSTDSADAVIQALFDGIEIESFVYVN